MSGRRKPRPPRITRNPRLRPEKITASFGAQTTTWLRMKMMNAMTAVAPRAMMIPMVPGVMKTSSKSAAGGSVVRRRRILC